MRRRKSVFSKLWILTGNQYVSCHKLLFVGRHVVLTETHSFTKVSHEEKKIHRSALIAAHPKLANNFDAEAYYKVPWTKVLDLVEKRKVYLHRGIAWVPMREQASLVVAEFSSRLSKDLEVFV